MADKGEVHKVLMTEGAFRGLRMLKAKGTISEREAGEIASSVYGAILVEVEEARKELGHIQTALNALASSARQGQRAPGGSAGEMHFDRMTNHLITFDAWVVSLMETDLTITGLLNPGHTRNKITELARAMNALMDKRASESHPVMDDPSLFRDYVDR